MFQRCTTLLFIFGQVAFTPSSRTCNAHPPLPRLLLNPCTSDNACYEAPPPAAQLPEGEATLHSLLTFVFPATPPISSNAEKVTELLSVAQRNQMANPARHYTSEPTARQQGCRTPYLFPHTKVRTSPRSSSGHASYLRMPDGH